MLLKKPDAFQLGSDDPDDPKVQKTLGHPRHRRHLEDAEAAPVGYCSARVCKLGPRVPGQSPVSGKFLRHQYLRHLRSGEGQIADVDGVSGRTGRSVGLQEPDVYVGRDAERPTRLRHQGFPPDPPPAAGQTRHACRQRKKIVSAASGFSTSRDIRNPKQVAAVQTCRGSHTHTLVVDPKDKNNVYIYVSGTSFVRQSEELAGCSGEAPDKDPNTALFRIEVIKVPLAAPQDAKVVSSPRVFIDPRTGVAQRPEQRRHARQGAGQAVRHRPVPRHHRLFGDRTGGRRLLRKWNPAGHQRSGESEASRRGKRSELCVLALGLVFERREKGRVHR